LSEAARERVQQLAEKPEKKALRAWMAEYDGGKYQDLVAAYLAPDDIRMVAVEGGIFTRSDGKNSQDVTLDSFRMANIPVTFRQYGLYLYAADQEERLEEMKPKWGIQADHPAVKVNWYDAVAYCNWLSAAMGLVQVYEIDKTTKDPSNISEDDDLKWLVSMNDSANGFRLPTEAEWEYAARGGRKSKGYEYAGSNDLDEVGWYTSNSDGQTHAVAQKLPNEELGLYDMSGDVWEWCADHWHDNYNNAPNDGRAWLEGGSGRRVLRGGSWLDHAWYARVADRGRVITDSRGSNIGFRLARD
ncbi:MAG TPA: formylglycine-generating enzyme family protein, partial [Phaeodactylibacter sp.]|nr:formylglycine-generating enzyme family protein [Phaeodactylibacter sp.]